MNKNVAMVSGAIATAFAAGSASGFFFAKKKLEGFYDERAKQEIADAKVFYSTMYKKDNFETVQSTMQHLLPVEREATEAMRSYQGEEPPAEKDDLSPERFAGPSDVEILKEVVEALKEKLPDPDEPKDVETKHRNVFKERDENRRDYDEEYRLAFSAEVASRDRSKPYVISQAEFLEGEKDYQQPTLVYYSDDNALVDERNEPINDVAGTVGTHNLDKFGHMSGDSRIVYIRNEHLELDIELMLNKGSFARDVLGFNDGKSGISSRGDDE